jgi:DNA-binding MarR family transcriptional regulator
MADEATPNTAVLMFIVYRAAESQVMAALAVDGANDITFAQSRLLARLEPGGMRLTKLADSAGVTKQTAGALVDQLVRSGHILRAADPTDGRARLVSLSEKGLALSRAAATAAAKVERKWREHLGHKAFDQMRDGLMALREITDPYL